MVVSEPYTLEALRSMLGTRTYSRTMGERTHSLQVLGLKCSSTPNMFSTIESKPHSVRKRMISNVYSKSHLQSSPDFYKLSQSIIFEVLLPLLDTSAKSKTPIDVQELNYAVAMDFTSAYMFGLGNGSNFLQDTETRRNWLSKYRSRRCHDFFPQELPKLYSSLRLFGIHLVPQWVYKATEEVETWCIRMCEAAELQGRSQSQDLEEGPKSSNAVVYNQLDRAFASKILKGQSQDSDHSLMDVKASEVLDHLAAGHETSGITLTYLLYELSQRSDLQDALRAELLVLEPPLRLDPTGDPEGLPALPSPRSIDTLPLLDAVLMETLRLHAAIPGPQPRITPIGPTTLVGYENIPAGVRVSAQPYSLHRNPKVFPEPDMWKPERWLDANSAQKGEMMRWFWAFGSGGRMCIGTHFAMQGKTFRCSQRVMCPCNSKTNANDNARDEIGGRRHLYKFRNRNRG